VTLGISHFYFMFGKSPPPSNCGSDTIANEVDVFPQYLQENVRMLSDTS